MQGRRNAQASYFRTVPGHRLARWQTEQCSSHTRSQARRAHAFQIPGVEPRPWSHKCSAEDANRKAAWGKLAITVATHRQAQRGHVHKCSEQNAKLKAAIGRHAGNVTTGIQAQEPGATSAVQEGSLDGADTGSEARASEVHHGPGQRRGGAAEKRDKHGVLKH